VPIHLIRVVLQVRDFLIPSDSDGRPSPGLAIHAPETGLNGCYGDQAEVCIARVDGAKVHGLRELSVNRMDEICWQPALRRVHGSPPREAADRVQAA
jgi:hypothetical protein